MERIKKYLLLIILVLLVGITINVKAENFNYYLSNSDLNYEYVDKNNGKITNVKRGDTVTITSIVVNNGEGTNFQLKSGKCTIRWDDNYFSLKEIDGKYYNVLNDINGLTIGSVNKITNKLVLQNISSTGFLKTGINKIAEFKFTVLKDAKAGETKIYQMDGEDSLKCYNVLEERTVNCGESLYTEIKYNIEKSNVNKLSMIKINGYELDYFNEDVNDYDIEVESNTEIVNIEAIKKDSKSTISGNYGSNSVKYGINKLTINVISESGKKNTYTFNINRIDSRSSNNKLSTLTLSDGEIDFNPEILEYNIVVENEVDKITIKSSLDDLKSKYVENFQEKTVELNEGINRIEIKIIAENNDEKTYVLNINRALSSNNSLKSLKVNDEKIKISENEFIYNIEVDNNVDEVIIKAEANDSKATIKLDDSYPLEVGENKINIIVTAANGIEASYIVNVTRKKLLSRDSLLTSLTIKGYDIDFKPGVTLYNLKIKDNEEKLEITATQEDSNAIVEIEGNKDLVNGSIIKINVKAEDGTYTRYFINIEKGGSGISPVIIIIIVLTLLLASCVGLIFYRKKQTEKAAFDKIDKMTSIDKEKIENNKNDLVQEENVIDINENNVNDDNEPIKKVVEDDFNENNKDAE